MKMNNRGARSIGLKKRFAPGAESLLSFDFRCRLNLRQIHAMKKPVSGVAGKMEKKAWETPKLIVLYRARPEEAVLQACKVVDDVQNGPPRFRNCRRIVNWNYVSCSSTIGT